MIYIVRRYQDDGKTTQVTPRLEDGYPKDEKLEHDAHTHAESVQSSVALETQTEDEVFEWREVVRGWFYIFYLISYDKLVLQVFSTYRYG